MIEFFVRRVPFSNLKTRSPNRESNAPNFIRTALFTDLKVRSIGKPEGAFMKKKKWPEF